MSWTGGANKYLSEWGEYERASGWTYARALMRSETTEYEGSSWTGRRSDITVAAHLRIHQVMWNRPGSFTLHVAVNRDVMMTHKSACTSLKQAKSLSDKWLAESDRVEEALRAWYAKTRQLVSRDGEEVVGFFSEASEVFMLLEWGHYTCDNSQIERYGSGYQLSVGRVTSIESTTTEAIPKFNSRAP